MAPVQAGASGAPAPEDSVRVLTNGGFATDNQIISSAGEARVPPWPTFLRGGTFSPDGRALAWVNVTGEAEAKVGLWVTDAAGSREIFPMTKALQVPSWSPDGRRVAIGGYNFGMSSSGAYIWIVTVDGSAPPVEILRGRDTELTDVAWSPDGSSLAYARSGRDLFRYDIATGTSTQITHGCTWKAPAPPTPEPTCAVDYGFTGAMNWSPDGTRLAATSRKSLVVVDVATGALNTVLSSKEFLENALWSPDGQWLAYAEYDGPSYKIPVAGGKPVQVAGTPVTSWQACPDAVCATLGAPRARAELTLKPTLGARYLTLAGRVRPATDEADREFLRIEVRVRAGGTWQKAKVFDKVPLEESSYSKRIGRPNGEACKVKVFYPGGWQRTGAKRAKSFAC